MMSPRRSREAGTLSREPSTLWPTAFVGCARRIAIPSTSTWRRTLFSRNFGGWPDGILEGLQCRLEPCPGGLNRLG